MRYAWWRFQPHPEWMDPHWSKENYKQAYAVDVPGEVRAIFVPPMWYPSSVRNLESRVAYQAFYFNAATGKGHEVGDAAADATGTCRSPVMPTLADWILVLEKKG